MMNYKRFEELFAMCVILCITTAAMEHFFLSDRFQVLLPVGMLMWALHYHVFAVRDKWVRDKWVRVMADYCSDGLWQRDGVMMDYDDLPISTDLLYRHIRWCNWYEDLRPQETQAFAQEGLEIAKAIKAELPDWTVIYFDESKIDRNADAPQDRSVFEYEITEGS